MLSRVSWALAQISCLYSSLSLKFKPLTGMLFLMVDELLKFHCIDKRWLSSAILLCLTIPMSVDKMDLKPSELFVKRKLPKSNFSCVTNTLRCEICVLHITLEFRRFKLLASLSSRVIFSIAFDFRVNTIKQQLKEIKDLRPSSSQSSNQLRVTDVDSAFYGRLNNIGVQVKSLYTMFWLGIQLFEV